MAYFAHAFKQVFIGDSYVGEGKAQDLQPGEYGFFDAQTWEAIGTGTADIAAHPKVVFAMGSFHTVDKVGGVGGLKESIKSKVIDGRYIYRCWKVLGRNAQSQIVDVGWDGSNAATAPKFMCGQTYRLRIDVKGSAVLRTVGHHLSHVFHYYTGCCDAGSVAVDPTYVFVQFAKQIKEHPIFSKFVSPFVLTADGPDPGINPDFVNLDTYVPLTDQAAIDAGVGALRLTIDYQDTLLHTCSADVLDNYVTEPLVITAAQLVNEGGDPCSGFKQLTFTERQAARAQQGSGIDVYRDFVLSQSYRQERYSSDIRLREALDMQGITPDVVAIPSMYDRCYILYGVPRKSNPSGVHDCDQYLIQFNTSAANDSTPFETWISNYVTSAGKGMVLEDYSGEV